MALRRSIAYHDPTGNKAVKNVMRRPQEVHADLGLIEDDNTPDMRKATAHPTKNVAVTSLASIQEGV